MTIHDVRRLLASHALTPTKLRGQHFLVDERILRDIVDSADITSDDVVLEVGPGFGVLTRELAKRAGRVVAVELDRRFEKGLWEALGDVRNVEIVWGDVLRLPRDRYLLLQRGGKEELPKASSNSLLPPSFQEGGKGDRFSSGVTLPTPPFSREGACLPPLFKRGVFKIVSNLPYEITTPFLWKVLNPPSFSPPPSGGEVEGGRPDLLVLLLQREVAERICAKPPRMNLLALLVQTFGMAEIIRRVPASAFYPPPRIESAVIRIVRDPRVDPATRKVILTLAKTAFSSPRKKIATTLKNTALLSRAGINPDARPETLTVENWIRIARVRGKTV